MQYKITCRLIVILRQSPFFKLLTARNQKSLRTEPLFPAIIGRMPRPVGVETIHFMENLQAFWAQIFFVNNTAVADHECLYPSDTILGGSRGEGKAGVLRLPDLSEP